MNTQGLTAVVLLQQLWATNRQRIPPRIDSLHTIAPLPDSLWTRKWKLFSDRFRIIKLKNLANSSIYSTRVNTPEAAQTHEIWGWHPVHLLLRLSRRNLLGVLTDFPGICTTNAQREVLHHVLEGLIYPSDLLDRLVERRRGKGIALEVVRSHGPWHVIICCDIFRKSIIVETPSFQNWR